MTITIIYATETGNAESLAEEAQERLEGLGHVVAMHDMGDIAVSDLEGVGICLGITSTWGEGDPPTEAEPFFEELKGDDARGWAAMRYSVLGLGDRDYPDFCQCGKDLDAELERHGAQRFYPFVECDVDYEEPFAKWLDGVVEALSQMEEPAAVS
ncbi:MAG: flavodoxin domain-containing protein [Verrucomicrobiota bacterium]